MSREESSGEDARRFTYELVTYGDLVAIGADYETLEDALDEMSADGWRFVESTEHDAIFERPV